MTTPSMKHFSLLLVLLAQYSVLPTNAQKVFWGSCPSVTGITAFDQTQFVSDVWYEAQRYDNWLEVGKSCVEWSFAATSTTAMTATTTMQDWFGNVKTVVGTMTQGTPVALFAYSITQLPGLGFGLQRNHDVYLLATDYTSYAVLWSCSNRFFKNEQLLWVLTRARSPTAATLTTARAAVTSQGLNTGWLTSTRQTNC